MTLEFDAAAFACVYNYPCQNISAAAPPCWELSLRRIIRFNPAFCLSIASGPPQPNVLQIRSMIADAAYTYMISLIDSLLTAGVIKASFLGTLLSFCDTHHRSFTPLLMIYMVLAYYVSMVCGWQVG